MNARRHCTSSRRAEARQCARPRTPRRTATRPSSPISTPSSSTTLGCDNDGALAEPHALPDRCAGTAGRRRSARPRRATGRRPGRSASDSRKLSSSAPRSPAARADGGQRSRPRARYPAKSPGAAAATSAGTSCGDPLDVLGRDEAVLLDRREVDAVLLEPARPPAAWRSPARPAPAAAFAGRPRSAAASSASLSATSGDAAAQLDLFTLRVEMLEDPVAGRLELEQRLRRLDQADGLALLGRARRRRRAIRRAEPTRCSRPRE